MFIYCICTQYLVGAPFALITASIRRCMEEISLWHCWGGIEAHRFSVQVWWVCWPVKHTNIMVIKPTFGAFGSVGRSQILLENEISIFKKLASRRKHEVLQNFLVIGCSDVGFQKTQWTNTSRWYWTPNHHRLWKLNTGLQATWAMSFSTLPPDSRTLVSKWNTKLALIWKEDFGPLGNSPVLLLLLLDPSLSPFLVKFTQILESIFLDNPHKLRFSRLVVHLFRQHFFLPLNFLLTCLDTALCEQLLWQWMFVSYPPCEGCQWLSSGQLSDQQSSPWLCSEPNWETILKTQETFAGIFSWLAD